MLAVDLACLAALLTDNASHECCAQALLARLVIGRGSFSGERRCMRIVWHKESHTFNRRKQFAATLVLLLAYLQMRRQRCDRHRRWHPANCWRVALHDELISGSGSGIIPAGAQQGPLTVPRRACKA